MAPTTGKAAAAAAAKRLLSGRITLVETLGDALDAHRATQQAVIAAQNAEQSAAEKARESHATAQAGGWTTAELHSADLPAPPTPRKRKDTTTNGATTRRSRGTRPGEQQRPATGKQQWDDTTVTPKASLHDLSDGRSTCRYQGSAATD